MVAREPADPVDAFLERYAMFRFELDDAEMRGFDWLLERARRNGAALARRPQSDFERPIMLLMIMETSRLQEEMREALRQEAERLRQALEALVQAGLARARPPEPSAADLERVGQMRLPTTPSSRPTG